MRTIDSPSKALAILFPIFSFPPISAFIGSIYAGVVILFASIAVYVIYVRYLYIFQKISFVFSVLIVIMGCLYMSYYLSDVFLSMVFIGYAFFISVVLFSDENFLKNRMRGKSIN